MTTVGRVEQIFPVTGPARLTLENATGAISVRGDDGDTIRVTAVKQPGRGFDHTQIELTQAEDGAVRVATRYDSDVVGWLLGRRRHEPCRVDYEVRLPRQAALRLSYVSGPAVVANLHGALEVETVEGPLDLVDLGGTLTLKTVSGPVQAAGLALEAPLRVETVSGPVDVSASRLPGAHVETVSGPIYLDSAAPTGDYHFQSVSGEVLLRLPAGARGVSHLHSLSGRLHSTLGHRGPAEAGVSVAVHSVSGSATIWTGEAGDPGDAAPPAPPSAPPAAPHNRAAPPTPPGSHNAERLAVLDRIARGELSVDEALKHLGR